MLIQCSEFPLLQEILSNAFLDGSDYSKPSAAANFVSIDDGAYRRFGRDR